MEDKELEQTKARQDLLEAKIAILSRDREKEKRTSFLMGAIAGSGVTALGLIAFSALVESRDEDEEVYFEIVDDE